MFAFSTSEKIKKTEHEILELKGTETFTEIREKYLQLLREYHTKSLFDSSFTIKRQELIDAYHNIAILNVFGLSLLNTKADISTLAKIFGVQLINCTIEDINRGYKRLCLAYHTDKHPNASSEQQEKIKEEFQKLGSLKERLIHEYPKEQEKLKEEKHAEENLRRKKTQTKDTAPAYNRPGMFNVDPNEIKQGLDAYKKSVEDAIATMTSSLNYKTSQMTDFLNASEKAIIKLIMHGKDNLPAIRNFLDDNTQLFHFRDPFGNTLMHIACLANRGDVVEMLCKEHPIYKNAINNFGQTLLYLAVWTNATTCLPTLLEGEVNNRMQVRDEFNNTLLHIACLANRGDVLTMLCDKKAIDIHAKNSFDQTPMFLTITANATTCVSTLLDHGAGHEKCNVPVFGL